MKILLPLIFLLLIVAACWDNRPKKTKVSHKIILETIYTVKNKYNLQSVGINSSSELSGNYPYKELGITFKSDRKLQRNEGRKMLLEIIQIFLDNINNNSEIQPFLMSRPFTEKNIDIGIINSHIDKTTTSNNEIFSFSLREKGIAFSYHIPGKEFGHRVEVETLEEAKLLASEN